MRKLFTFFALCLLTLSATAQQYVFIDKNGHAYDDGATITCSDAQDDGFGGIAVPAGLFVKNVGATAGSQVGIEATISKIDNGRLQLCFPTNCQSYEEAGTYEPTGKATLAADEAKDLQTEWMPTEQGECTVVYKAKSYQGAEGSVCRTITVKYKYGTAPVQQNWWGYVTNSTKKSGLGTGAAETYDCAIFIPGNHAVAADKTINAIRFGLVAKNATNVKVWLAASLPATADKANTLQIVEVPAEKLGKENIDVELNTPYAIPAAGVYVGYTFTISKVSTQADQYPILTTGNDDPNSLIIKTSSSVTTWSNMNGQGFGSLFLQVLLEGVFDDNSATVANFGPVYAMLGGSVPTDITVKNLGGTPISSIDYTITSDGVTGAEQHADIETPIVFNEFGTVTINIAGDAQTGSKEKLLNITKVNGNPNLNANEAAKFTVYTLPEIVERNVVVEEFTGTGCGWCPRGLVGMENLRKTYGDRFIGIGLHQYNSGDAMYINKNSYAKVSFQGAPSCRIDRKSEIDPYYGSSNSILDDFAAEMAIPAYAKVSVSGTADYELTTVAAKAEVEALFNNSEYTLEFVVVADNLKGTGSSWNQTNYYYQYSQRELPEDLAMFGNGGKYGTSTISGWAFNDVALCSSYVSSVNMAPALGTLAAGEKKETEYTLTMPTKATLVSALQRDQLYVIALVVDKNKQIVNAAKAKIEVSTEPSAISTIDTTATETEVYYTLDGKRLDAPQKGMNIVRMSDGTTKKIVVK